MTPATKPTEQLRSDGSLRHLLTLEGLPRATLESLLERAARFVVPLGHMPPRNAALHGKTVAIMFAEPSTRTRVSLSLRPSGSGPTSSISRCSCPRA